MWRHLHNSQIFNQSTQQCFSHLYHCSSICSLLSWFLTALYYHMLVITLESRNSFCSCVAEYLLINQSMFMKIVCFLTSCWMNESINLSLVLHTDSSFSDLRMMNLISLNDQAKDLKILLTDNICRDSQSRSNQTDGSLRLKAAAESRISL